MRSHTQPPASDPTAITTPPMMPVTSATDAAEARQSLATADQRFDAAPEPMGRKQRKSATNPMRARARLQRSAITNFTPSPTFCGRTRGGSYMKRRGIAHSRQSTARIAPAIHGVARRCASTSPTPPPMPLPPRLPAWNQPPARPFSSSGVARAIRLSVAIPTNVAATLATKMMIVSSGTLALVRGSALMAHRPAEVKTVPITYHFFEVNVVSTTGAHRNFQTFGTNETAMSAAIASTLTWFFASRNASATVRKPLITPNGATRNM